MSTNSKKTQKYMPLKLTEINEQSKIDTFDKTSPS